MHFVLSFFINNADDNDDDLCEGGGNCRLSAEPRVADIPGPEHRLIIVILAELGPGQLDHCKLRVTCCNKRHKRPFEAPPWIPPWRPVLE